MKRREQCQKKSYRKKRTVTLPGRFDLWCWGGSQSQSKLNQSTREISEMSKFKLKSKKKTTNNIQQKNKMVNVFCFHVQNLEITFPFGYCWTAEYKR
jgi:hypothetical protein